MRFVSNEDFSIALQNTMKKQDEEFIYEAFIGEIDSQNHLNFDSSIHLDNHRTVSYLKRAGFLWRPITEEYIRQYYAYFIKAGYFIQKSGGKQDAE